jgi:uncharacterized protein
LSDRSKLRMQVVTLSESDFVGLSQELYRRVIADGYAPTHIVAIASGGTRVRDAIKPIIDPAVAFVDVALSRQLTRQKKRFRISALLSRLPYVFTDRLRILEHWIRLLCFDPRKSIIAVPDSSCAELQQIAARDGVRILVLDDAADSGVTLSRVLRALAGQENGRAEIRTAVITSTWKSPLVRPNYYVFNGVLCRFPWSHDYRN